MEVGIFASTIADQQCSRVNTSPGVLVTHRAVTYPWEMGFYEIALVKFYQPRRRLLHGSDYIDWGEYVNIKVAVAED